MGRTRLAEEARLHGQVHSGRFCIESARVRRWPVRGSHGCGDPAERAAPTLRQLRRPAFARSSRALAGGCARRIRGGPSQERQPDRKPVAHPHRIAGPGSLHGPCDPSHYSTASESSLGGLLSLSERTVSESPCLSLSRRLRPPRRSGPDPASQR
jgi:hypothetical protein